MLAHLQSIVLVLLRTTNKAQTSLAESLIPSNDSPDGLPDVDSASRPGTSGEDAIDNARMANMSISEMNKLRNNEISLKAMSASLLLLLRWFKASRL